MTKLPAAADREEVKRYDAGVEALAYAVLEKWLTDACSSHLWAVEEDVDDAKIWLDACNITPEIFKALYDRARAEGSKKDDPGQSVSLWYLDVKKRGAVATNKDYEEFCKEHGLKMIGDGHKLWEITFISKLIGEDVFDGRRGRKGEKR